VGKGFIRKPPKRVDYLPRYTRDFPLAVVEAKANCIAIFKPEDAQPHTHIELQPAGMAQTANGLRLALELVNIVAGIKGY
jgi:hypothetical protein